MPIRSGRRAVCRAAVTVLIALGIAGAVPYRANAADPGTTTGSPSAKQVATNKQVTVTIDRLDPKLIKADSTIVVAGTLTNTTRQTLTDPAVRLQGGPPLRHRWQLTSDPPPPAGSYLCDWVELGNLAPGRPVHYQVSCPASQLALTTAGTYPLLVNVNATQFDGNPARVGEAYTTLPYYPDKPAAPTKVSWLWPIVDRPHQFTPGVLYGSGHRQPAGIFRDDVLASSLAPTGRLGRLVSTALNAPAGVSLTVPIDPELVAEAAAMRHGYRVAHGSTTVAGTGAAVARQWLSRLQQLIDRPGVTVTILPYADPDLVALADAGLGDKIGPAYEQGATVLRKLLSLKKTLSLAWPAGGELDNTTLYTLAGQSLAGVVLSSDALPLRSSPTPTPDAAATLVAQGSTLPAVVTDSQLDEVVATRQFTGGVRLVEQRFISALAMITAESPARARDVVIAPPRHWASSPTYLKALLADTAAMPWATSGTVAGALAATPSAQRGSLQYPDSAAKLVLPSKQTDAVRQAVKVLDGFRQTLSNSAANSILTPYYKAALAASSTAWRSDPALGVSFLRDLRQAGSGLDDRVYIVPPSTKRPTYTLASSSSPLVLTVANTLSAAVTVRVAVSARGGSAGFRAQHVDVSVPPNTRSTVKVPTHVERSGIFPVLASITTPTGQTLGAPIQLRIRSTAYGIITLAITGGAFVLLVLLVGRRMYRRIRAAHQPTAHEPGVEYPTGEYPKLTARPGDSAS